MSELVLTYRGLVSPRHCDHMGHMNVMWYVGKFDEATWNFFNVIGLPPSYFREHSCGLSAVRQNITYRRELRVGDVVSIWSGLLAAQSRMLHFYHEMCNDEGGWVAAAMVIRGVHIDLTTRQSRPFAKEKLARFKELIIDYQPLI